MNGSIAGLFYRSLLKASYWTIIRPVFWGIEANYPDSDNAYLTDVANELLPEALDADSHPKLKGM